MTWNVVAVACFLMACCHAEVFPGPAYPATKGEIWPKPQIQIKSDNYYVVDLKNFTFAITGISCMNLERAVIRYEHMIANMSRLLGRSGAAGSGVQSDGRAAGPSSADNATAGPSAALMLGRSAMLRVRLMQPCDRYPHLDMDESYDLTISDVSSLKSDSIWGILRGLESFSQSLYYTHDFAEIRMNSTVVQDFPRFAHRGLLIDTSRHYLSLDTVLTMLDAMAYNKLNVLHWHIVDDQSFPYGSEIFPTLSGRGAYDKSAVYTLHDVRRVVNYARDRGIRVLPEFDVPGHTRSWGEAFPKLLTQCHGTSVENDLGPMNPINEAVYDLLRTLLVEVKSVFPDHFIHVGGDEVDHSCWLSNPEIKKYMSKHNMTDASALHELFMSRVVPLLPSTRQAIVWQEVFTNNVTLPAKSIVQIWKAGATKQLLIDILRKDYRIIYSSCWYLDDIGHGGDWQKYYECDPRGIFTKADTSEYEPQPNLENIIGGEACMWGEVVDDTNVMSRVWPRASAAAEKLWSAAETTYSLDGDAIKAETPTELKCRLEEHVCRMRRRGVPAQPPNAAGYCRT